MVTLLLLFTTTKMTSETLIELTDLLSSHTTALTTLYTSLGYGSETVTNKLHELHSALIGTVKRQRQQAEDEVEALNKELEALKAQLEEKAALLGCALAADSSTDVCPSPSGIV